MARTNLKWPLGDIGAPSYPNTSVLVCNRTPEEYERDMRELDAIILKQEQEYASKWKTGDTAYINQMGYGTITKIDYNTGDVWVDNMIENWLPIGASALYNSPS